MRAIVTLGVLGLLGAGCGEAGPCELPPGCAIAGRVGSTCACTAWQVVSTETVSPPFVVASIVYPLAGNASIARYGFTTDPSAEPTSAASVGATLRAVVRRTDGRETVARVALDDLAPVRAVTDQVVGFGGTGGWFSWSDFDDLPAGPDFIDVWVNPALTVAIDAAGGATVTWSSRELCLWPGFDCRRPELITLSTDGPLAGSPTAAWLEAIGPDEAARILDLDAHRAGAAVFPRYLRLADVAIDETPRLVDASWHPCASPGAFEVLAETATPLQGGETLVLQYGVLPDAACAQQRPGLILGTATSGCSIQASVLVDRLFGTLLVEASSATASCAAP